MITTIGNVELAPEGSVADPPIFSNRPKIKKEKPKELSASIDLHMEVLNPSLQHGRPERIVDIQIKAAKEFIDKSIAHGTKQILIIHGKGEGVLKSEIDHLLSLYDEVKFTFSKNNGGATEVWFT